MYELPIQNDVMAEASRCLKCKNPKCRQGCPIGTEIPEVIEMLLQGKTYEAGEVLFKNNPLSVICSLVCPHERQCEGNCVLGIKGDPVKIGQIEHYISSEYMENKVCSKEGEHVGKVAIVGSGPAGLSIANILALKGYDITIYEAHDKIGGVLRYGIPEFRLPKEILDKVQYQLEKLGVKIRPNTLIGPLLTVEDLFNDGYDAVFIGTGVWNPKRLNIPGETLWNVHFAIDYLKNPDVYKLGDKVCVIGAGNVAMDAARTAVRHGAKQVEIMYRRGREDVSATNHEVDGALEDGIRFRFYESPVKLTEEGVAYTKTDGSDDTEFFMDADSIIVAVSQGPKSNIISKTKDITTNHKGLVVTDMCGKTTKEGVFASGDVVTGANTVVEAVKYSKNVAEAIHNYVRRKKGENVEEAC
ncbi:MAG: NAD(P)-dependent oxidoreductase [Clostridia bacterium]|nr:NAD(P)-dependent oxidoreductase [Clostridia bacterium]